MVSEKWQYQVVDAKSRMFGVKTEDLTEQLNRLGQQGWELVTVKQGSTSIQLFMKRKM